MRKNPSNPILDPFSSFYKEDQLAYQKVDTFKEALETYRVEFDSHELAYRKIQKVLNYFETDFLLHMSHEENYLFPYLEKHLPRLESIISVLISEHAHFRWILGRLREGLCKIASEKNSHPLLLQKVKTEGLHLCVLIKTHVWAENQGIYRQAEEELSDPKKNAFGKMLARHLNIDQIKNDSGVGLHRKPSDEWY